MPPLPIQAGSDRARCPRAQQRATDAADESHTVPLIDDALEAECEAAERSSQATPASGGMRLAAKLVRDYPRVTEPP